MFSEFGYEFGARLGALFHFSARVVNTTTSSIYFSSKCSFDTSFSPPFILGRLTERIR